jgi:hypothetical protein
VFLKEISQYFDDISLSEELIHQITLYLKDIYEAEGKFYQEQKTRLRKEQDQIQELISKMYDERYDGKIDEIFFNKKLKEYKAREFAILQEMESHAKGDERFHITIRYLAWQNKRGKSLRVLK